MQAGGERNPMRLDKTALCALVATGMWVFGCAQPPPPPPKNVTQYTAFRKTDPEGYPRYVVLQHNLQRVLDGRLPEAERVASLKLVAHLGEENPEAMSEMAAVQPSELSLPSSQQSSPPQVGV